MSQEVWVQKWEKSGPQGTRLAEYSLHVRREFIDVFRHDLQKLERQQSGGAVPDEYSRPLGSPYLAVINDADLLNELNRTYNGIWGPGGNNYPEPA